VFKRRALAASLWSGGDILFRQGLQFLTTLVLARLLVPADFGAVAMLALFIAVANMLVDAGFGVALIQSPEIDHDDESTVFWCNLAIGAALSIVLFALAPLVAAFYALPGLAPLMRFMAATPLLAASSAVHFALLTRKLDFRTQAIAGGIGATAGGIAAIAIALRGGGAWALAALPVVSTGCISAALWALHRWRPALAFRRRSFERLAGFGGYVLASSLLEALYSRLYTVLIGRRFGAADVGYYANADNTRMLPLNFLGNMLSRIGLPLLSAAGNDVGLKARGFEHAARAGMLAAAVLLLPPIAFPEQVLVLLFGGQWIVAAPLLRILALAGLLYPLHALNLQLLLSAGRSAEYFRIEAWKKVVGVALLFAGIQFGAQGVAWSQVVLSVASLWINASRGGKVIGRGTWRQLGDVWPPLLAVGAAWACAAALDDHRGGWTANLSLRCVAAAAAFSAVNLLLWRPQLRDVAGSLREAFGGGAKGAPSP
jgi:O-antigen/teichoic acid export membrane protein